MHGYLALKLTKLNDHSNNDGMALGALEATKAHGKKLPIFGVDALPEVLQLVKKGENCWYGVKRWC